MNDNDATLQQLKDLVGQIISQDQAHSFVQYARLDAFTDETGKIDEDKVIGHLTAIALARTPEQQPPSAPPNWGQHSGNIPGRLPGADARDALAKRHHVKNDQASPGPAGIRPGARGREALAKRHGGKK